MSVRTELFPDEDILTNEIDRLLEALPADLLETWQVYERRSDGSPINRPVGAREHYTQSRAVDHPSDIAHFMYLPESIEPSPWIVHTNTVSVRHQSGYERTLDIDPDGDRQEPQMDTAWHTTGNEPKYVVYGTFAEPIVTRSLESAIDHLETAIDFTTHATEFNAEIERLSYRSRPTVGTGEGDASEEPDDPEEYIEQNSPVSAVKGIGSKSLKRLAKDFGTYYNVAVSEPGEIGDSLSMWHHPTETAVIHEINQILDRYNRFRQRDDWNRVDDDPDTWMEYPTERPCR